MYNHLVRISYNEQNLNKIPYWDGEQICLKEKPDEKLRKKTIEWLSESARPGKGLEGGQVEQNVNLELGKAIFQRDITLEDAKEIFDKEIERFADSTIEKGAEGFEIWKFDESEKKEFKELLIEEFQSIGYEEAFKLAPLYPILRKACNKWCIQKERYVIEKLQIKKTSPEEILEKLEKNKEELKGSERYVAKKLKLQANIWKELVVAGKGYEKLKFDQIGMLVIDAHLFEEHGDYAFENEPGSTISALKGFLYALKGKVDSTEEYIKLHSLLVGGLIRGLGPISLVVHERRVKTAYKIISNQEVLPKETKDRLLGHIQKEFRNMNDRVSWLLNNEERMDYYGYKDLLKRSGKWHDLKIMDKSTKEKVALSYNSLRARQLSGEYYFNDVKGKYNFDIILKKTSQEESDKFINEIFSNYNAAIENEDAFEERLMLHIWLMRELALAHPFTDGNSRTAWHIFNGLMKEDPQMMGVLLKSPHIDALSPAGCLQYVIDGMKRFREKCSLTDEQGEKKIERLEEYKDKIEFYKWDHWHDKLNPEAKEKAPGLLERIFSIFK